MGSISLACRAENLRRLASVPLRAAPGTAFNYSLSTDVLGAVLERAGDAPLPELVARFVTGPLELATLAFTASPAIAPQLAVPYSDGAPPRRIVSNEPVPFPPFAVSFAPEAYDVGSSARSGANDTAKGGNGTGSLETIRRGGAPSE